MTFVPWPPDKFVRHIEGTAYKLRRRLDLADLTPLDPEALIGTYPDIKLLDLGPILAARPRDNAILSAHSAKWSAMAYREGQGPWLVVWNPWHAETRVRASVMEEVAHIMLGHRPTKLVTDPLTGLPKRTYTRSKEQEAYGVAAASLVPFNGLVHLHRTQGRSTSEIARHFCVSEELVTFRINVTGLRKAA